MVENLLNLAYTATDIFLRSWCPYQKGQVECTNAILHKHIKKKSDFHSISDSMLRIATEKLNNLPRKCLNFLNPKLGLYSF